jgi:hypothetical protein
MTEVFVGAGVWASAGKEGEWIDLKEIKPEGKAGYVSIKVGYGSAGLKPAEARKLSEQLYEMATSVETRGK